MTYSSLSLSLNSKGLVKQRESQLLEFKESFHIGDALVEYARTLAGMSNNQGGAIVFGVKDSPHFPVGLKDSRFEKLDPKELNRVFLNHFSQDVQWRFSTIEISSVKLGVIEVEEAKTKPILCIRKHDKKLLREGAIYFRYRAETCEIRYSELRSLLDHERDKERDLWMKHIQSIATIGPHAVQFFNSNSGEMTVSGTKVLLDENILSKLKIIKEGSFSQKKGAPTLRLIGDLEGVVNHDHVTYNDTAYPYTTAMLVEKLGLNNSYEFQALITYFTIKGNAKYHARIATGKTSVAHKYSDLALDMLSKEIRNNVDLIELAKKQMQKAK